MEEFDGYLKRAQSISVVSSNNLHHLRATPYEEGKRVCDVSDDEENYEAPVPRNLEDSKHSGVSTSPKSAATYHFDKRYAEHLMTMRAPAAKAKVHSQSAEVFEALSPFQDERRKAPHLSPRECLCLHKIFKTFDTPEGLPSVCPEELKTFLPNSYAVTNYVELVQSDEGVDASIDTTRPLRIAIIMSGGPAPGGHNVIAGLYDYLKSCNLKSELLGVMGGIDGLLHQNYKIVTDELMSLFRNQGGFDMLATGRGKFNGEYDLAEALHIATELQLDGLLIVGGDGSNSNAALLAEYFEKHQSKCCVVGIPKTIDGDLKNSVIEVSFGFDTAAKTYSELIGNLCNDAKTARKAYHFIRVMGRAASHLLLECAFQTRPNLAFIGEEIAATKTSLQDVVKKISDMILARRRIGKEFGVVLLPEGLIECFPEMKCLFNELNEALLNGGFDPSKLKESKAIWEYLPAVIQQQLLLDREASGYIQVAKIATERLLVLLVQTALESKGYTDLPEFVPHYFGYEGRCAMPTNFDSHYCYSLGYNGGILVEQRKNGYMSVIRGLVKPVDEWRCAGIPFWQMMAVKSDINGQTFPAIERKLVDLNDRLFKVFAEVRSVWELNDSYCYPGPVQFDGPLANARCFTLDIPEPESLMPPLSESEAHQLFDLFGRPPLCMSALQKGRLTYTPSVPPVCKELSASTVIGNKAISDDPYTQRQIALHYPHMTSINQSNKVEIMKSQSESTSDTTTPLRVGIVYLSRQFPGAVNVLWGLYERAKLSGGKVYAFSGLDGLLNADFIRVDVEFLSSYYNCGGMEPIGRSTGSQFLTTDEMERIKLTCEALELHGLVLPGSAFVLSTASFLCEYFLSVNCETAIVGVPCTGSNNLVHELIETCVGFDSSTKVYASLIGNILTDASSMPKYWHFIRLMGRQPSHEVLECALQTHPNVVIIGEEYGASDKTLMDVVRDIADVVCKRNKMNKNFGTVLIPDALLMHIPNIKLLITEIGNILNMAAKSNQLRDAQRQLVEVGEGELGEWAAKLTPWNLELLKAFPKFFKAQLLLVKLGEVSFERLGTEELLAQMVQAELERRKAKKEYNGKFAAVTHFFGYQGRSAPPSKFDCTLALSYGYLAGILVENRLTGYCCSLRGLCGKVSEWKCSAVPFTALMKIVPAYQFNHADIRSSLEREIPVIPSAEVNLNGKAFRAMKFALQQWSEQDRFCNPGPMQFFGAASSFYNRTLFEDHYEYFHMLRHVEYYSLLLLDTCKFGVSKDFLKQAFVLLNGLLVLSNEPSDLPSILPYLGDIDHYNAWKNKIDCSGDSIKDYHKKVSSMMKSGATVLKELPSHKDFYPSPR